MRGMLAAPVPAARPQTHAIVLFGKSLDAQGQMKPELVMRLETALTELERDPASLIVVSGGAKVRSRTEAAAMKRWLVARGISPQRVIEENKSRNTLENAEFVAPILKAQNARRITLVTEDFHMDRSSRLLSSALAHHGFFADVFEARAPDGLSGKEKLVRAAKERTQLVRHQVMQTFEHLLRT
jgi:uncharacterized SAM-binding protein YcdF (DUF218 family)